MHYKLILLLSVIPLLVSQAQMVDSLQKELKNCKRDSVCIKIYLRLSGALRTSEPTRATEYAQKALEMSDKNNLPHLKAEAFNSLGMAERNYSKALVYYQEGLKISSEFENKILKANILTNIGSVYIRQGNYTKGLEYNLQSLRIYEITNDKKSMSRAYNNISALYEHTQDYDKAIEYAEKAIQLKKEIEDFASLGNSYSNLGNVYAIKKDYTKALQLYEEATQNGKKYNNTELLANNYTNIGYMYWEQGLFEKSLENYQWALDLDKQLGNEHGVALSLMNVASIEKEMKKYTEALRHLEESLSILKKVKAKDDEKKALNDLADLYATMGQYEKAFRTHQKFVVVKDSVLSEQKTKQIAELRTQYETEKKEQENKLLQSENERKRLWLYLLITAFLLLLIISIFIVKLKHNQIKGKQMKLDLQAKELISFTQSLIEKDNFIDEIRQELSQMQHEINKSKIENVEQLLTTKLSTENDWVRFKQRFEVLYPDFFMNLQKQFPQLSPTEVKICAIEKLGIKDAEAGDILGVNPESVKKSRYRLRKSLSDTEKLALKSFIETY